jgi:UDP-N-acetylmuramoylalanine--D-glutamate ligase
MKQKIAIWGLGITGAAALNYFTKSEKFKNYEIDIFDNRKQQDFDEIDFDSIPNRVNFYFSTNEIPETKLYEFLMISPSIGENDPTIIEARKNGIPIYNDTSYCVEKWREESIKLIGVTGSNGKSTVVNLIHGSLQSAGVKSILVGNIGKSPLDYLLQTEEEGIFFDTAVFELSSYQLETFSDNQYLDIAVITNISPNHLDHHNNSMEEYVVAKLNIAGPKSEIVTVSDDEGIQKYVLPKIKDYHNVTLDDIDEKLEQFVDESKRKLKGIHNLYNIAIALKVIELLNLDETKVTDFIKNYSGLENRIEFVREVDGVKFINDSKSTSPHATTVALETFGQQKNIVLIAGGTDKQVSLEMLHDPINKYVSYLVILDHDINLKMQQIAKKFKIPYTIATNMKEAVDIAIKNSNNSDTILLSPAAASLGKYKNFEHRGEIFKQEVTQL